MKILITAHSSSYGMCFRQKVVETDKENVRDYFHSCSIDDILDELRYPKSRAGIKGMKAGMTTDTIPNFIAIDGYDVSIILNDTDSTRIDLLLQEQVDIIEGTRQ